MSYQLSLDSCTKACSVALTPLEDGQPSAAWFEILERGHAEIIAHQAQVLMQQLGIKASDITQLAVTIGPGTFTGARIALSFARMFAAARNIPIIAVNSLEAIALNAVAELPLSATYRIHTAIDARRGQVYFATYNGLGDEVFAPQAIEIDQAMARIGDDKLILGTGRNLLTQSAAQFDDKLNFPNAKIFGKMLIHRAVETAPVSPLYLRAADAKLPASHPISFTK